MDIKPGFGLPSEKLNLSIAPPCLQVYCSPTFWGPISDVTGRRSVFIGTFIVYLMANIVLAVSTNYAELMVFRAVQAAGSASTISIGKRKNDPSLLGV